jgi:signal transduction histidine kinase
MLKTPPLSGRIWHAGLLAALLMASLMGSAAATEPKRVLMLLSFGRDFRPWSEYATDLRIELNKQSPWPLDIIEFSLVSARSSDENPEGPFTEYLQALFVSQTPDLIIGIGAPAAGFVQRKRDQLFKNTPMLFTAIEARRIDFFNLTANDTVVAVHHDFSVLFENILRVLPDTENIVVINGVSPNEIFWKGEITKESEPLQNRVRITWVDHLSFEETLKYAAHLPPHSAIFWYQMLLDSAGVVHEGDAPLKRLYAVANAPIFSHDDAFFFGRELVGGPMHSVAVGNGRAAAVAIRLLGGEHAGDIRVPPSNFAPPKFDWKALQRWGISESRLPAGSEIFFRDPSAWEQYRVQILLIFTVLFVQTGLISWLFYEHRRRHLAEIAARNSMSELAQMNRLASAGELSASIAHEINQPLAAISTRASTAIRWLGAETPNLKEARTALDRIVADSHRAADIITSIRALLKKDTGKRQPININNLILKVLGIVRIDLQKNDIELQTRLEEGLPAVDGSEVQLQQVILNLVLNAIDAMHTMHPRVLRVQSEQSKIDVVHVSIEDTGTGIEPSNLDKIFNALFTTKAGGMGMGLSICKSIIESHDGRIWVSPAENGGSVLHVELPIK